MSDSLHRRTKPNGSSHKLRFTADTDGKVPLQLPLTLSWEEIPEWQRDNEYLLTGYRRVQNSWKGCLLSVYAYLHNETVNIHTHLWGALLFLFLLGTYQGDHIHSTPSTTWVDSAMFALFLVSACFCLLGSSVFHMSTCHSEKVSASCHALDYSGIVVLIVGSFYPTIYYAFYNEPFLQYVYITGLTGFGVVAAYIVLNPDYAKPSHRSARTSIFIALGGSGVLPTLHCLYLYGYGKLVDDMGFKWLLWSGSLYVGGALIYAFRVPERFSPGTYDFFCASHQIFHVCVVLATIMTYRCILHAFRHAHSKWIPVL